MMQIQCMMLRLYTTCCHYCQWGSEGKRYGRDEYPVRLEAAVIVQAFSIQPRHGIKKSVNPIDFQLYLSIVS